jgi:hypothetical protein
VTPLVYPVCFLALAALSGLAAASGRRWALRLPLIALTPMLALAVWWELSQRDGWPTTARLGDGSTFVAAVVEQPAPGNAGAIYVWAQPASSNTPRSFRLPYSPQLEQQVEGAARAAKRGSRVGLRTTRRPPRRGKGGAAVQSPALQFYRLPPHGIEAKAR